MWLLAAMGAEAATLNLEKDTYQFGGTATANIAIQNGENNIFLLISPEFGYFPADRVELRFAANFLLDEEAEAGFGLAAGVDYFLKGEWVAPYIGAQVGVGNRQLDETPAVLATGSEIITAGVRAGMLLPMSQTTGFDIGVRVNYNQPLQKGGSPWVSIPLGYTGVRAFFR